MKAKHFLRARVLLTGVVKAHKRQGAELLYCIERDGQSTWYGRTAVILTMEQGNRLREQYGLGPYEPSTPQNMASDISLGVSRYHLLLVLFLTFENKQLIEHDLFGEGGNHHILLL